MTQFFKKILDKRELQSLLTSVFFIAFSGSAILFLYGIKQLEYLGASDEIIRLFYTSAAGYLILTVAMYIFFRWRLLVFMHQLDTSVQAMADGTFLRRPSQDTLLSQFSEQLNRLYHILEHSRKDALTKQKQLQNLLSDISHQSKTPAANLQLLCSALSQPDLAKEDRMFFLKLLREQTEKLVFLMTALEKCSRLDTGMIVMKQKSCILRTLLEKTISQISPAALRKNIDVTLICDPSLTSVIDRKWTAECIFNFLDNAVKYTSSGGHIRILVQPMENYIRIDITDNGRGIPAAEIPHIFKRFYREDAVSEQPGIGMGLYIARKIILKQGGYIHTASCPNKGSTFSIHLPKTSPHDH